MSISTMIYLISLYENFYTLINVVGTVGIIGFIISKIILTLFSFDKFMETECKFIREKILKRIPIIVFTVIFMIGILLPSPRDLRLIYVIKKVEQNEVLKELVPEIINMFKKER